MLKLSHMPGDARYGHVLFGIVVFLAFPQLSSADGQSGGLFVKLDMKAPSMVYDVVANGELAHSGAFGMRHIGQNYRLAHLDTGQLQ